jgi:hypothetical protein
MKLKLFYRDEEKHSAYWIEKIYGAYCLMCNNIRPGGGCMHKEQSEESMKEWIKKNLSNELRSPKQINALFDFS